MITDEQGNEWYGQSIQTTPEEEGTVYDKELGKHILVRSFKILTDPTKVPDPTEVLEFHKKDVLEHLAKSGWKLLRELMIGETKTHGLYEIIAICEPQEMHGTLIGATDANPINASQALQALHKTK